MKRNEFHDFFRWPLPPKTEFPSPPVHLTNSCVLFFHYGSIYFVYDSSTICFVSSYNKKKKKTKNINTSSLSSYCLENRLYNYNSTRFRYINKKKKKERRRRTKNEREKIKWNTRCCFLSPFQNTRVLNQAIVARSRRYFCFKISALKLRWPQP